MISRKQAIEILRGHGLKPHTQTCSKPAFSKLRSRIAYKRYILENGVTVGVKSGTSFDEEIGCRQAYSLEVIKAWLGY